MYIYTSLLVLNKMYFFEDGHFTIAITNKMLQEDFVFRDGHFRI